MKQIFANQTRQYWERLLSENSSYFGKSFTHPFICKENQTLDSQIPEPFVKLFCRNSGGIILISHQAQSEVKPPGVPECIVKETRVPPASGGSRGKLLRRRKHTNNVTICHKCTAGRARCSYWREFIAMKCYVSVESILIKVIVECGTISNVFIEFSGPLWLWVEKKLVVKERGLGPVVGWCRLAIWVYLIQKQWHGQNANRPHQVRYAFVAIS